MKLEVSALFFRSLLLYLLFLDHSYDLFYFLIIILSPFLPFISLTTLIYFIYFIIDTDFHLPLVLMEADLRIY